jgi:alpha-tubulin suppressor-like RCC1 family protein
LAIPAAPAGRAAAVPAQSVASGSLPWVWGMNLKGQLADGTFDGDPHPAPNRVATLSRVTRVAAGAGHILALEADGTVYAWGDNLFGQCGNGARSTEAPQTTPVRVSNLDGVVAVAAGAVHSLALKSDGTVWSWGHNDYGQLGNGTAVPHSTTPVQVTGLAGVTAIAAGGGNFSLALTPDGAVWAWGDNGYGQLGNGATLPSNVPVAVSGLSGVTAIAAGASHSLALRGDGVAWAWGRNSWGQLGDGSTTHRYAPVQVAGLSGMASIAAGGIFSLAIKHDATAWAWGWNGAGNLGDGTTEHRSTPVQVAALSGVSALTGGAYHSLALTSDGSLWSWGYNGYGELGDGSTTLRIAPVQVSSATGLTRASAIAAGAYYSLALQPLPRPAWDVNGDHVTDIGDVALIGLRWLQVGAPGWIPEDVNADAVVDIGDVAVIGTHWLETW